MRTLSLLSGALLALSLNLAIEVGAQDYPNKPVRVILPLAPGGATDIQARLFSQKLTQALGQTFLVDNRPGAGGMIAFKYIVQLANSDGYTVLATSASFTTGPTLYKETAVRP